MASSSANRAHAAALRPKACAAASICARSLIRSQFNYLEKHKHYIEKIETKRGWWRLTAAGRAVAEVKGAAH